MPKPKDPARMARKKAADPTPEPAAELTEPTEGYTVVARRYRPQQFEQLIGQDAVSQALGNAITSNRVAHAYLFTGARGVGKTSTARILAKCLNCVKGPTLHPCNECDICKAISVGEDVDVLEIDAASNRGIDEMRDLRSNVQYRPQRGRYKIYIIDEVHMLTTQAFNALLKTLEEPPAHVKFIMATTEATKIPITILSRCQRFDFAGIGLPQLKEGLAKIVASEGKEADPEAIELVARRAGGSMRDAQSLLDQLLSFSVDRLSVELVHQLLGTANEERVAALAHAIADKDAKQALALVAEAADRGLQLGELLDQLIEYWRDLMVVQAAGAADQTLSVTGANRDRLAKTAAATSPETILAGLDVLVTAKTRLRNTSHGRVVLEMAVVRLARLEELLGVSRLVQLLQDGGAVSTGRPGSAPPAEKKKLTVSPPSAIRTNGPVELTTTNLPTVWQALFDQAPIILKHHLAAAASQAISGPNALVVSFPAGYNPPSDVHRGQLEALLEGITGHRPSIRFAVSAIAPSSQRSEPTESPSQKRRRHQEAVLKEPLLAKAVEVLGAQLVSMDEGFGETKASTKAPSETGFDTDSAGDDAE
jgi:DNA polymerase III subunit gamma/tau